GAGAMRYRAAPPVPRRYIGCRPVGSPTDEAARSRPYFPLPRLFSGRQRAAGLAHPCDKATLRASPVPVEIPSRGPLHSEFKPLRLPERLALSAPSSPTCLVGYERVVPTF